MDYDPAVPFEDRPSPGWGLLGFIGVSTAALESVVLVKGKTFEGNHLWYQLILTVVLAYGAFMLFCVFSTRYRLRDKELFLRSGPFRIRMTLDEIQAVERVKVVLNKKGLGITFESRGFCNRYTNCLRLKRNRGLDIYLSPSDPEAFARRLGFELPKQ